MNLLNSYKMKKQKSSKVAIATITTSLKLPAMEFWDYKRICQQINQIQRLKNGTLNLKHERFSAQKRITEFIKSDLIEVNKILQKLQEGTHE